MSSEILAAARKLVEAFAAHDTAASHERETIVFRSEDGGRWLAVHEHLSGAPQ